MNLGLLILTPGRRSELERVNAEVNRFPYRTDPEQYGRTDYWIAIDEGGGDCEDYALRKRADLIKLGWPKKSLSIGVCDIKDHVGKYWGHAVLVAHTSGGRLVLDNRSAELREMWSIPDYEWRKISLFGSLKWWLPLRWIMWLRRLVTGK